MIKISSELIKKICSQANSSPRKRKNHNFHKKGNDPLQRMLNVLNKGTYIRPHKHVSPNKREAFIILKGIILYVEFSDKGDITEQLILDPKGENYGVEITPKSYHSIIALEDNSVVYEIKDGPYDPKTDKIFASWAPDEYSKECKAYLKSIINSCNLKD